MRLLVTGRIYKLEFLPLVSAFTIEVLKSAARKSILGLGVPLSGSKPLSGTVLVKIKVTSQGGAGRILFLLYVKKEVAVLVMIRHKNDKQIGQNMAIVNSKFKKVLDKNLDLISEDIANKDYQEFDLG